MKTSYGLMTLDHDLHSFAKTSGSKIRQARRDYYYKTMGLDGESPILDSSTSPEYSAINASAAALSAASLTATRTSLSSSLLSEIVTKEGNELLPSPDESDPQREDVAELAHAGSNGQGRTEHESSDS